MIAIQNDVQGTSLIYPEREKGLGVRPLQRNGRKVHSLAIKRRLQERPPGQERGRDVRKAVTLGPPSAEKRKATELFLKLTHNPPRVVFQNYPALRHFLSSEAIYRFVSLTQFWGLECASLEGAEGVMVKWNARRAQGTRVRPFSQILIHTNSGTLLSSTKEVRCQKGL